MLSVGWSTRNLNMVGFLSLTLWAYYTLKRTSPQATPSLGYRAEKVAYIEVMVPSVQLALASKLHGPHD